MYKLNQWCSKLDDSVGGGGHIHTFVLTDYQNSRFKKKLMIQRTRIYEYKPPNY